jgi:hypothetical protein
VFDPGLDVALVLPSDSNGEFSPNMSMMLLIIGTATISSALGRLSGFF